MKLTEDRKVNIKSDIEIGEGIKVHVKTTISLPFQETDDTKKIVEMFRLTHANTDDYNQTALPLKPGEEVDADFDVVDDQEDDENDDD